jgi:dihydroneopterin aldolase
LKLLESIIFVRDLRLYAFHGVMPQERKVGGWFVVSLHVHYSIAKAIESDEVADTLNYAELCDVIRREMNVPSQLLEHVAGRIASAVFQSFPQAEALHLTIVKENPPMGANCSGAGVELHLINDKTK